MFPLNNDKPALKEPEVRRAMMHAIDRDSMLKNLEQGLGSLATSNMSPAIKAYYEPDVVMYPHDPAKAKSMLDAAGWVPGSDGVRVKNGVRLSFTCTVITGDQRNMGKAVLAQSGLKDVGIEMKIDEQAVPAIISGLTQGQLDASIFNWTYGGTNGEPDATTSLGSTGSQNMSHYKNSDVDSLLLKGISTIDPAQRKSAYSEIQKDVAKDVPFLYMMYWDWIEVWSKRVHGVPAEVINSNAPYRLIYTYWLES
jgi:peptide/nickel transport system substrate-binding protein